MPNTKKVVFNQTLKNPKKLQEKKSKHKANNLKKKKFKKMKLEKLGSLPQVVMCVHLLQEQKHNEYVRISRRKLGFLIHHFQEMGFSTKNKLTMIHKLGNITYINIHIQIFFN
jgi:hypothetical protein